MVILKPGRLAAGTVRVKRRWGALAVCSRRGSEKTGGSAVSAVVIRTPLESVRYLTLARSLLQAPCEILLCVLVSCMGVDVSVL